jgi:hypothetical protein
MAAVAVAMTAVAGFGGRRRGQGGDGGKGKENEFFHGGQGDGELSVCGLRGGGTRRAPWLGRNHGRGIQRW